VACEGLGQSALLSCDPVAIALALEGASRCVALLAAGIPQPTFVRRSRLCDTVGLLKAMASYYRQARLTVNPLQACVGGTGTQTFACGPSGHANVIQVSLPGAEDVSADDVCVYVHDREGDTPYRTQVWRTA